MNPLQDTLFSVVPEATHEASQGFLKGAMSAQKALQGSETEARELLGGTKKNSVHPEKGSLICLDGEIGALKFLEPSRWARELAGGFDGLLTIRPPLPNSTKIKKSAVNDFSQKGNGKNELVARPAGSPAVMTGTWYSFPL